MDFDETKLDRFCRVCMVSSEGITADIYSQPTSPDQPNLRTMLGIICPAVFSEGLSYSEDTRMPHTVCSTCEHAIGDAYRLHQTCVETDRKFREKLLTVKQEPLENASFESVTIDPVMEFEVVEVKVEEPDFGESMSYSEQSDTEDRRRSKRSRTVSKKETSVKSKRRVRKNQKRVHASCELCSVKFDSYVKLRKHLEENHPDHVPIVKEQKPSVDSKRKFQKRVHACCGFCSAKFDSYVKLRKHLEENHPDHVYGCEKCKRFFLNEEKYEEHRHFHIAKEQKLDSPRKFQKRVHASCKHCSEKFDSYVKLKKHLEQNHPDHVFACELCEKIFLTEDQYEEHRQFHITGKRFGCQFCGKRFKHRKGLDGHLNEHTSSESSPCPVCGKTFRDEESLRFHVKRHSKLATLYPCEQCPVKLSSMAKMKAHMLTHTKERNHVCETCGSRFTVVFSLLSHMKNVHGDRNFTCETCNQKFSCAKNLHRHMRTHTGEKPYVCPYCDRAYAQSNDLIKHSRIHVGDKPYSCDRCSECFRFATELRNHYRVHFSAAEKAEADATGAMFGGIANKAIFSITEILKRRFEAEQQQKLLSN